jgi:hypothetical protein
MGTNVRRVHSTSQTLHRWIDPVCVEAGGRIHCAVVITLLPRRRHVVFLIGSR